MRPIGEDSDRLRAARAALVEALEAIDEILREVRFDDSEVFEVPRLAGAFQAHLAMNFDLYTVLLLPETQVLPVGEQSVSCLFLVQAKDDMGVAWDVPMSVVPVQSYTWLMCLRNDPESDEKVVIKPSLYSVKWLEPLETDEIERRWGSIVSGRARPGMRHVHLALKFEDESKDWEEEVKEVICKIGARRAALEARFEGQKTSSFDLTGHAHPKILEL